MLYPCIINSYTSWSFLPWKKIYTKIAIIQYKIYKATMYYQFNKVCKLQKFLLNSNEAKIIAIKQVTETIRIYYSNKKSTNFLISNEQKFKILKNFYNNKIEDNINLYFLVKKIHLWIIYLSMKPEWQAKFIYNSNCYNKTKILSSKINLIINEKVKALNYIKFINFDSIYFNNLYWYTQLTKKLVVDVLTQNIKKYLNIIFEINYFFIVLFNYIKLNYLKINETLFYLLRKNFHYILQKKSLFLILNNKYLNKILYILKIQCIYNAYCYSI